MQIIKALFLTLLILLLPSVVSAGEASSLDTMISTVTPDKSFADLLWIMIAAFLVFFMQAGFALVETGFTRAKNVANIMMKNMMDFGLGTVFFWAIGFGIMYGADQYGLFGFSNFFLSEAVTDSGELNPWLYGEWFFQAVFAATAATIVSGAMAERTKFTGYLLYTVFITALIYPIVGHWIWGGGWLSSIGFHDFAGSTVVHSVGAWAGLVGTMILGPRIGRFVNGRARNIAGHSVAFGTLGVFILWLGWFGFNPGSTLGADVSFARIAVTTNMAGAGGAIAAMIISWIATGKADLGYTLNGSLAGLVAITAGCAVVSPASALLIGCIGGLIMFYGTRLLERLRIDDPVGAIPVHGMAGAWGTLAVALFAQTPYSTEFTGLFFGGGWAQLGIQLTGIVTVFGFTILSAFMVFKGISVFHGLRVTPEEEITGLDRHEHGTNAYPEFFGLQDAAEMMELTESQQLELIRTNRVEIDVSQSA
ncbi:ammonium transporter [Balneola sp. MJW-20]|uniref:ammonium transporter n=1 Tax=Gracilimonas aurantiaca TaxID=3234185 RepID=UPI003466D7C6